MKIKWCWSFKPSMYVRYYFDKDGNGPLRTTSWEFVEEITVAAQKAVRR